MLLLEIFKKIKLLCWLNCHLSIEIFFTSTNHSSNRFERLEVGHTAYVPTLVHKARRVQISYAPPCVHMTLHGLMGKMFESSQLNVPLNKPINQNTEPLPYTIVADAAFPLKTYLLKPYLLKLN